MHINRLDARYSCVLYACAYGIFVRVWARMAHRQCTQLHDGKIIGRHAQSMGQNNTKYILSNSKFDTNKYEICAPQWVFGYRIVCRLPYFLPEIMIWRINTHYMVFYRYKPNIHRVRYNNRTCMFSVWTSVCRKLALSFTPILLPCRKWDTFAHAISSQPFGIFGMEPPVCQVKTF